MQKNHQAITALTTWGESTASSTEAQILQHFPCKIQQKEDKRCTASHSNMKTERKTLLINFIKIISSTKRILFIL